MPASPNKKQTRQAKLREFVRNGKINDANGNHVAPSTDAAKQMFRNLAFGYKLGRQLGLPVKNRR